MEEVTLNESRPERTTRMGTLANKPIRQALAAFLKMNQNVFAWSHKNMPKIAIVSGIILLNCLLHILYRVLLKIAIHLLLTINA